MGKLPAIYIAPILQGRRWRCKLGFSAEYDCHFPEIKPCEPV